MTHTMRFATNLALGILGKPDSEELWHSIISYIPDEVLAKPDVKILNVAFGHLTEAKVLVNRMRALGKTAEEIKNSIYLLDKYQVFCNDAKRKGYRNIIHADFLTYKFRMKFDVTIGNPPYQNQHGVNSHALWEDFVTKAHELTVDGGYIAMVTPFIGRRKVKQLFFNNNFIAYVAQGVDKYFPGIGSSFCYHIVQKGNPTSTTNFDGLDVDISAYGFIPSYMDENIATLFDELLFGTPLNIQGGGIHSQRKNLFSDSRTEEFPYEYQHTSSQRRFCSQKCAAMDHKLKVVCSKSGYLKPWLDTTGIGITEGSWCIPVDTEEEGNKIIEFLNSDKVKLFNSVTGSNTGAHDPNKYKRLCL